jgi:hypothetical protein
MAENPETAQPTTESHPDHASWPRRIGALVIDWIASSLVFIGLFGYPAYQRYSFGPLVVFFVEATLGTMTVSASFGQLLTRIRVLDTEGRRLGPLMAGVRTFLICLVVPPLIFKPDSGRGLHDLATRSAAFRLPRR